MPTRLQNFTKFRQNPELQVFLEMEKMKKEMEMDCEEMKKEMMAKMEKEMEKMMTEMKTQDPVNSGFIEKLVKRITDKTISDLIKETKGDKGDTPTKEELLSIIKPLIPEPIKGDKPVAGIDYQIPQDGYTPIKNKDYKDGYTPIKGKDYFDGQDGRNPEPKEIIPLVLKQIPEQKPQELAKKLNTLTEEIKMSVIAGLQKELQVLRQNISGVKRAKTGGGTGNFLSEEPSGVVNNSNTTFTLTNTPKNNSLLVIWNGQIQRPGASNEYTLSGKIITFNTAPNAGAIWCIYMR